VARAIGAAVRQWNPHASDGWQAEAPCPTLFGLAGSPMLEVWRGMGIARGGGGFADRRYEADGTLRSRQLPDALITDPAEAAAQAVRLVSEGGVETICVAWRYARRGEHLEAVARALQSA